ncbi:hypothetical protein [Phytoactinopolyspora halophila]|uniref:hypothetical protein n=1 Tax=Phytoactinopolyspora halophila TaxID=1981511 RepID=UPI000F502990|nr:hypothetical protein [Phytoactinopolyspora halophila]
MDVIEAVGAFRDGRSGEWGGIPVNAGPATFWLVVALLLTLIVLYRGMRKHLRRVNFDESGTGARAAEPGTHRDRSGSEGIGENGASGTVGDEPRRGGTDGPR